MRTDFHPRIPPSTRDLLRSAYDSQTRELERRPGTTQQELEQNREDGELLGVRGENGRRRQRTTRQ